jgi:anti-sigma B factor antagonist
LATRGIGQITQWMPRPFSLDVRQEGSVLTVTVRGELDVAHTPELCGVVEKAISAGAREVVIDCRGMEFLDSSGVGALLDLRTQLAGLGGVLILFGPMGTVAQTLAITGLDREFQIVEEPGQSASN